MAENVIDRITLDGVTRMILVNIEHVVDSNGDAVEKVSQLENDANYITQDSLDGLATEDYVDQKIAEAEMGGEIDLSEYAKLTDIPTNVSAFNNDSGYITSAPTKTSDLTNDSGFVTENELGEYAKSEDVPTKVSDLTNDSNFVTESQMQNYTYDKATIDSKVAQGGTFDPTVYYTKSETNSLLDAKADTSAVPSKTSDLTNDSGFITSSSLDGYALSSEIPTKTSDLTNDSGFITDAGVTSVNGSTGAVTINVPTKTSDLTNDSNYATTTYVDQAVSVSGEPNVIEAIEVNGTPLTVTNKTVDITAVTSVNGNSGAVTISVPTNTSDLVNDSNFATESYVDSAISGITPSGGGDTNVIEIIEVNGTALVPDANKAVDITVPTAVSDLTNDLNYATESYVDSAISGITPSGGISEVQVNGTPLVVEGGSVDITVPTKTSDLTNDGDGQSQFATLEYVAALISGAGLVSANVIEVAETGLMSNFFVTGDTLYADMFSNKADKIYCSDAITTIDDETHPFATALNAGKITYLLMPALTYVGDEAFRNTSNAVVTRTLVGWDSIEHIGDDARINIFSANPLSLPNIEHIGNTNVSNSASSITIGSNCTYLGNYAVTSWNTTSTTIYAYSDPTYENANLTSLTIADSTNSITCYYAYGTSTTTGTLSYINTPFYHYCGDDLGTVSHALQTLYMGATLVPSETIYSNYGLFSNHSNLTEVTIGPNVTSISDYCFYNCTHLTKITCRATTPPTLGTGVFENTNNCSIYVPEASYNDYTSQWSGLIGGDDIYRIVALPYEGFVKYRDGGNYQYTEIEGTGEVTYSMMEPYSEVADIVKVGDLATAIGNNAFVGFSQLGSVEIGDSVTRIGNSAFLNCSNLSTITIGNGVESIGYSAFLNCSYLSNIALPDSCTTINASAFAGCSNVYSITFGTGITSLNSNIFGDNTRLTVLQLRNTDGVVELTGTIPSTVTTILVPSTLVSAYKADSAWSAYRTKIRAIQ